jgi:hypothetical protein
MLLLLLLLLLQFKHCERQIAAEAAIPWESREREVNCSREICARSANAHKIFTIAKSKENKEWRDEEGEICR